MDLLNKTIELCKRYGIKPARSKGQNFLVREDTFDFIVNSASIKADDVVLEVGPGLGFMTAKLAEKAKQVLAVELDDKLAGVLDNSLKKQGINNVVVLNQDIMKMTNDDLRFANNLTVGIQKSTFKVVANLPYNITSMFLRKFLSEMESRPEIMVLMLQKEVAERIVAEPGDMSLLALSVQYYAQAEILRNVPASDFYPAPEVDSAVIRITTTLSSHGSGEAFERRFFQLARIGFSAKRKMLKNNLAAGLRIDQKIVEEKLVSIGHSPKVRAEELSVEDWLKLVEIL